MGRVVGSYSLAVMLLVILKLNTSLAKEAEASLLQVSQIPTLQSQPQVVSQLVPQVPPAQLVQSSVTTAVAAVHNGYAAPVAPASGAMTIPSAGSMPSPIQPARAMLTATASGAKAAETVQMNATALAFGQLSSLDTEFKELHEDDASHVRQLKYNVQLRTQLQEKLRQARDQLAEDNERLAERTMQIIAGGDTVSQPHSDKSQPVAAENGNNETFAALLLEAAVVSRRNREINNAQISTQAQAAVKSLVEDIAALRARDEEELQALRANAESRTALHKRIDERGDQLNQDTNLLVQDLNGIRNLAAKEDTNDAGSNGGASDAPVESPKQETAQNEGAPDV